MLIFNKSNFASLVLGYFQMSAFTYNFQKGMVLNKQTLAKGRQIVICFKAAHRNDVVNFYVFSTMKGVAHAAQIQHSFGSADVGCVRRLA